MGSAPESGGTDDGQSELPHVGADVHRTALYRRIIQRSKQPLRASVHAVRVLRQASTVEDGGPRSPQRPPFLTPAPHKTLNP